MPLNFSQVKSCLALTSLLARERRKVFPPFPFRGSSSSLCLQFFVIYTQHMCYLRGKGFFDRNFLANLFLKYNGEKLETKRSVNGNRELKHSQVIEQRNFPAPPCRELLVAGPRLSARVGRGVPRRLDQARLHHQVQRGLR